MKIIEASVVIIVWHLFANLLRAFQICCIFSFQPLFCVPFLSRLQRLVFHFPFLTFGIPFSSLILCVCCIIWAAIAYCTWRNLLRIESMLILTKERA